MKSLFCIALAAVTLSASVSLSASTGAATSPPRFIYSPYQFLALSDHAKVPTHGALTWAFATGECGDEIWKDRTGQQVADANVAAFVAAKRGYLISTGGADSAFTCGSDAGMERFIARYASPQLLGIDFDIEHTQTPAQVDSLIQRARNAQKKHPQLRYSFTIATHAASDGSRHSLNPLGETILAAVKRSGLKGAVYNLMVMDYGPASAKVCVMGKGSREGVCDMGASALQAARNAHEKYGIAYSQIALTAMIGVNDVVTNVFSLDDAATLAAGVKSLELAGLHFWSLDRDQPCAKPTTGASDSCSTLDVKAGEFARALGGALR